MVVRSADTEAGARRPRAPQADQFEAVVYVHGIGSQRRYEETSRLVDQLDEFSRSDHGVAPAPGRLSSIKGRVEPLRDGCGGKPGDIVGYIDTTHSVGDSSSGTLGKVRFYEAYWAPVMADVTSARDLLFWLLRQPGRPWRTLTSPWRDRQRLRRSRLVALLERNDGVTHDEAQDVLEAYSKFEQLDHQDNPDYRTGSFGGFLKYLAAKHEGPKLERLKVVAKAWRRAYVLDELRNMLVLWTMALFLLLLGAGALTLAFMLLEWASGLLPGGGGKAIDGRAAIPLAVAVAGGLGLTKTFNDYLGDVQAWATYQETDAKHAARNETLERCMTVLMHVLKDPNCGRVTIVAHSLGTSVAHDALLALRRRNLAAGDVKTVMKEPTPLEKIEHFVTLGSPIDKIEYFFESFSSYSHRFKRVVEDFRGDINEAPFTAGGLPHIHWINYWDQADIISGALHSPAGKDLNIQRVDNVQVASLAFPAIGGSHSGYFTHRRVVSDLFAIIYGRQWSFVGKTVPDIRKAFIGPVQSFDPRVFIQLGVLALPWLILAGLWVKFEVWGHIAAAVTTAGEAIWTGSPDAFLTLWSRILAAETDRDPAVPIWIGVGLAVAALVICWRLGRRQRQPIPPRATWRKAKAGPRAKAASASPDSAT